MRGIVALTPRQGTYTIYVPLSPHTSINSLKLMCIFDEIIEIYDKIILTLGLNTARKTKSLLFPFYLYTFIYNG